MEMQRQLIKMVEQAFRKMFREKNICDVIGKWLNNWHVGCLFLIYGLQVGAYESLGS
jgi:hypothetical protein